MSVGLLGLVRVRWHRKIQPGFFSLLSLQKLIIFFRLLFLLCVCVTVMYLLFELNNFLNLYFTKTLTIWLCQSFVSTVPKKKQPRNSCGFLIKSLLYNARMQKPTHSPNKQSQYVDYRPFHDMPQPVVKVVMFHSR